MATGSLGRAWVQRRVDRPVRGGPVELPALTINPVPILYRRPLRRGWCDEGVRVGLLRGGVRPKEQLDAALFLSALRPDVPLTRRRR